MPKYKNHNMDYDFDCGPCSVAIWLSAYNINLNPNKLIETLGTTPDNGTSWKKIRGFITKYNLFDIKTDEKNLTSAKQYLDNNTPLFICWQVEGKAYWSHYSILAKMEWNKIVMLDPENTEKFTSMDFSKFIYCWGKEKFWYAALIPNKRIRRTRSSNFADFQPDDSDKQGVLNVAKVESWIKQG